MSDPYEANLEQYFFADRGIAPEATSLFTGVHHGENLSQVTATQFQLSPEKAEAAIEAARREVAL